MSSSDKRKMRSEGVLANLAGNIAAEMAINQTLDFIRSMAKGELDEDEGSEEIEQTAENDNQIEPAEFEEEISEDVKLEVGTVNDFEEEEPSTDETIEVTSEQDTKE